MKYKIAIVDTHPIQYRAPLFRQLAQRETVDLTVCYGALYGEEEYYDNDFGVYVAWGIPLLGGYRCKHFRNISPWASSRKPWLLFNPGILPYLIMNKFDAVILYGYASINSWFLAVILPFIGMPTIFIGETTLSDSSMSWFPRIIKKIFFSRIKACLYIGKKSLEYYNYLKVKKETLFFAPYTINNEYFIASVSEHRKLKHDILHTIDIRENLPIILTVSKISLRKRIMDILYAFEHITHEAALIIVGDGRERGRIQRHVDNRKLKNVYLAGFVNQKELPRYYAIADIFVLSSSYESWGLVINEAMCAQLPLIVTQGVAASYDLVQDGKNGYIYRAGDINRLTQLLDDLLSDERKRKLMGTMSGDIISGWNYDQSIEGILNAVHHVQKTA